MFATLVGQDGASGMGISASVGTTFTPGIPVSPNPLAMSGDTLAARAFQPEAPTGKTLDVWPDAAAWAGRYWNAVAANDSLELGLRAFARGALDAVAALAARVTPSPEVNGGE